MASPIVQESMMKHTCIASLAALFIALPAAAQPASPPMGPGRMPVFADFDANGDGHITEPEFTQARSKRIAERATEGRAMRGLGQAADFKEIDSNGDGVLSRAEFDAHQSQQMPGRPTPPAR
jgi:hypothetical protein